MTKGQTSKMEARKKKNKAAAAQRWQQPLPAGWIQGDFLPSTVMEGDLLELVEHGQLVHKSWRLPADDEVEPAPREGERVLLLSHVHRGSPLLQPLRPAKGMTPWTRTTSSRPSQAIHRRGGQGRADPAVEPVVEPVLEAAPPAVAPAADAPPTEVPPPIEPAPVGEEPTGANLGMPQYLPTIPGSSNVEFSIRSVPEDKVGAAKGAMVQVELMAGEAKRAYDSVAALYR
ncbi:hypothetical protein ZWY2020_019463 [Hordeum vulgare]|nr:hypothetical protein ZWY2020_019463 [Hordeum vulgare]